MKQPSLQKLMAPLSPLNRKLLRDFWHIRGQAAAIALVIGCGVAMFVMAIGMIRSLDTTRQTYYDRYNFADIYAPVVRAPKYVAEKITAIPGVRLAESRISVGGIVDVRDMEEPVTAALHSIPLYGEQRINQLVLRSGRMIDPRRSDEVLASENFAQAHHLEPGDTLSVNLKGKKRKLKIAGLVLSPEYVYAIAPGQLIPDNARFAILWMGEEHLAAAYDLRESFNEILALTDRNANKAEVIRRIDQVLERYGGTGAYTREDQISNKFLLSEMDQLRTMTGIIPPIFLGVAAFLINVVVSRLIETEREQIGLLKAFGYATPTIAWHYMKLVLAMTSAGVLVGLLLGAWLGHGLARMYQNFYTFPFLYFDAGLDINALAALISYAAAVAGTAYSVWKAVKLPPAAAMRPPAPVNYSGGLSRRLAGVKWLDEPTRMIFRHILRRPGRAALTLLGMTLALGLRIASGSNNDDVDAMLDLTFNQIQRQDATLSLNDPRGPQALHALKRLPGIGKMEPFRAVPAILRFGAHEKRQGVTGVMKGADLDRLIDTEGRAVDPPPFGIVLSTSLARQLEIGIGDILTVEVTERHRPVLHVRVTALVDVYIGTPAYMSLPALNAAMHEGRVISGAYASFDADKETPLYRAIKETPVIAGISLNKAALKTFQDTMDENLGTMVAVNVIFSSLIVIGVIYNNARISLSERARDLASLRVLGFMRREVSYILLGELALLTVLSLPFGIGFGIALAKFMAAAFSTDLYTIPYALSSRTVALSVTTVLAAAAASALIVRHRIDKLDLIRVLKTRE